MSDSEEPVELPDEGDDDLFGDGEVDAAPSHSEQEPDLSENDAASDLERRRDDLSDDGGDAALVKDKLVMSVPMYRHRTPKAKDGQLQSLRVPKFLKFNPEEYKNHAWEPSKWDLENAKSENSIPVIRYQRDPTTGRMQSNANIYKWSDGSVTLEVGEDHYEVQTKSLVPPANKPYQELQDAHYYAAAAHLATNNLLIVGHVTEQYTLKPNKHAQDDALERLTRKLEAAKKTNAGDMIIQTREDPELKKRQAEQAEKERARAQRKRETAAARLDGAAGSRYNRGALSINDLEGGSSGAGGRRGQAGGRKRGQGGGAAQRKRNRNPEYDSDDDLPAGAHRQDDYVLDDFAVASDEEGSEELDDDEEEEEILDDDDEDDEERAPKRKKQRTADAEGGDEDADGEADNDATAAPADSSNRRRRQIIDDDDE